MDTTSPERQPLVDRLFGFLDSLGLSDRILVTLVTLVFLTSLLCGLLALSHAYTTTVPTHGGTLVEGVVGTPRFINPVLAVTRADTDLTALTYSGLLKRGIDGSLVPDLAESVTVSDDGLVYNVILKRDRTFHDGTPIDAEDVAFTVELIQDPALKSPLRGNWSGVSVEVIDTHELNFVLSEPYTPFMENLTVGVMPAHIWKPLSRDALPLSQHNTDPVGSGPYRILDDTRDRSGLIDSYTLAAHKDDGRSVPHIRNVEIRFYRNEQEVREAMQEGRITSSASFSYNTAAALGASNDIDVIASPLPRIFSVFFNQSESAVLTDQAVRKALARAVDREVLISRAVEGYGTQTTTPLPPGFHSGTNETATISTTSMSEARALLKDAGYTNIDGSWTGTIDEQEQTLAITLATVNTPIFTAAAEYLTEVWGELGIEVSLELYEEGDLVQQIIRPREYELLLFGMDIGRGLDLYPFWHSSQREDPGLNIGLYTNIRTDALLETARTASSTKARDQALTAFSEELISEDAAIFLFSPSFVYVTTDTLTTDTFAGLNRPHERFSNIETWYLEEEAVWPIFIQQ